MSTANELYWLDKYGKCKATQCKCLKTGWKGILCEHWQPLGVKSQEELLQYHREQYNVIQSKKC